MFSESETTMKHVTLCKTVWQHWRVYEPLCLFQTSFQWKFKPFSLFF